jgi:repressor LexA
MTRGLTLKQERILEYIEEYANKVGYPPSIREIGRHFGITSLRGVTVHLDALERKGYIKRASTARSITIVGQEQQAALKREVAMLPLVGTIAAGAPITASENIEGYVPVPQDLVHNTPGAFVLEVKGDSMVGDHILPRDLVVIRPQATAEDGDLVAFLLGDEATIKRIRYEGRRILLVPSNPAYEPIVVPREGGRIIGKVVGLVRKYRNGGH